MPIGPAVAAGRALQRGADLMDRALDVIADQAAIGADLGLMAVAQGIQLLSRAQHAAFDDLAERDAHLGAFGARGGDGVGVQTADAGQAAGGDLAIGLLALDADIVAAQHLGDGAGGAGAEERVQHHVARIGRAQDHPVQQRFGFLRRMRLVARRVLQPFAAVADGQHPVAAHLDAFVQRLIVEGVFRRFRFRGPDQRLMRVGQPLATEIRHGVRLAPDDVVHDPEALILDLGADAKDVVIAADHPDRAVRFQQAAGGGQPIAGEGVIGGKAGKLVPMVIDRIDLGIVGTVQIALQLQVVGRVGKDQVHAALGQAVHDLDAVAAQNLVQR